MECDRPRENFKCVNCGGPHSPAFGGCPKRKQEQQIIKLAQELNIPKAEARNKVRGNLTFAAMAAKAPVKAQKSAPEDTSRTLKTSSTQNAEEEKTDPSTKNQGKEDYYKGIEKELKEVKKMLRLPIDGIMEAIPSKKIESLRESAAELLESCEELSETEFSDATSQTVSCTAQMAAGLPAIMNIRPSVDTKKSRIDEHAKKTWQRQWLSPKTSAGKFYIKHSPTALFRPAFFGESRAEQLSLSKIRLDKLNLNYKLFKENLHPTGLCDTCKKYETTKHALMECPRYGEERKEMYKSVNQKTREEISLSILLKFQTKETRRAANYNPLSFRRPIQDDRWDEGKIWQLLIPTGNPSPTDPTLLGNGFNSYSQMKEKMKIASNETIGRWTKYLREVVFHLIFGLSAQFTQIGGVGKTVEIYESLFGKKRKYRRGNYKKGEWVFGGVERGTNRFFLVIVPDRKRKMLLAIIKQYIAPGPAVISDEWRAFKCLGTHGYIHLTVNHSKNFKDPITDAHTNTVEGMWAHAKRTLIKGGTPRNHLFTCLALFMMKRMLSAQAEPDTFVAFMKMANTCVADGNVLPETTATGFLNPNRTRPFPPPSRKTQKTATGMTNRSRMRPAPTSPTLIPTTSCPSSSPTINPPSPLPNSTHPEANDPPVEPSLPKRQRRIPSHLQDYQL
ncbi:Uncharacterized protein APZ42_027089 [Daphnia magna]|uniref:ISXO2-like transposase domain-containing protein n=1 Tax=Daphnia magna TaxID=35525 RepID=A0A162D9Q0_9CRUS|nr:Uncharacterized protein APZ42_027089 [Daphnia magna]